MNKINIIDDAENRQPQYISATKFAADLGLKIIHDSKKDMLFNCVNVNRPGLQLSGYFDFFAYNRVQVLGNAEVYYLEQLDATKRTEVLGQLFETDIPCVVFTRGKKPDGQVTALAKKFNRPLFVTDVPTTIFINNLVMYLNTLLCQTTSLHGGLIDVHGIGVLLSGKSGIGKSETALELIKRGHRLVCDDVVEIRKINDDLIGRPPQKIRHLLELRGVGIINVCSLYGIGAVLHEKQIDLNIELVSWQENVEYDRLGDQMLTQNILGTLLPKLIIPVKPGRNLAVIIEAAAANYRAKKNGYDALKDLNP